MKRISKCSLAFCALGALLLSGCAMPNIFGGNNFTYVPPAGTVEINDIVVVTEAQTEEEQSVIEPLSDKMYVNKGCTTYEAPGKYEDVGRLEKGSEVVVVGKDKATGWYLLENGTFVVPTFLTANWFTEEERDMYVVYDTTPYEGPDDTFKTLDLIKSRTLVHVVGYVNANGWSKLADGTYVDTSDLYPDQVMPFEKTFTVTKSTNVRSGPATSFKKVSTLKKNSTVTVTAVDLATGWYIIEEGKYISGDNLKEKQ